MKRLAAIPLLTALFLLTGCGASDHVQTTALHLYRSVTGSCGVERWEVKTMTDSHAGEVNLRPHKASIAGLITRPKPGNLISSFTSPRNQEGNAPWENHAFTITGKVIYAKHEADQDVHLALEDPAGNTMIVESTYPGCAQGSRVLPQMATVRAYVEEHFATLVGSTVTVSGVGFSDFSHGQTGVAPNAIELHPLTAIESAAPQPAPALHLRTARGAD
jgi:hypothetical protein